MWGFFLVLAYGATGVARGEFCPGALNGGILGVERTESTRTHLVVSHCGHNLDWLAQYFKMSSFQTITIISKCGIAPAPTYRALTIKLPNVGRCDHTYAWWMVHKAPSIKDDDVVFFVKDTHHVSVPGSGMALANITLQVAKSNGFACAQRPNLRPQERMHGKKFNRKSFWSNGMTLFAYTAELDTFSSNEYNSGAVRGVAEDHKAFKSSYKNFGEWRHAMGMEWPSMVPVCFGGMFAVRAKNIKEQSPTFIRALKVLSRGNNLEEGHFMERSWAALLQTPLSAENMSTVQRHAQKVGKAQTWNAGVIYANCVPCAGKRLSYRHAGLVMLIFACLVLFFTLKATENSKCTCS